MKLVQLKNIVNGFASIDFASIDMNAVLKEGNIELLQGKIFKWNMSTGDKISDCPFYIGVMPIFDTNKLSAIIKSLDVKTATFEVEGRNYTIISAPHFNGPIIDRKASEMRTFRNGKVMSIKKYVFNAGFDYPTIFTPEEFVLATFCVSDVAQRFLSCHFSQLQFLECIVND
jgi:hypothetical protein